MFFLSFLEIKILPFDVKGISVADTSLNLFYLRCMISLSASNCSDDMCHNTFNSVVVNLRTNGAKEFMKLN